MPSPIGQRTVDQIDEAIRLHRRDRERADTQITEKLRQIDLLRRARATATTRIDQLLEERGQLTGRCPDTPEQLDTPGDRT
jgi:chromosome segregation ATPase